MWFGLSFWVNYVLSTRGLAAESTARLDTFLSLRCTQVGLGWACLFKQWVDYLYNHVPLPTLEVSSANGAFYHEREKWSN